MGNIQNLRVPTSEQAREIGRKGGSVCSPKKKLAARLRVLKKKGLTNENAKRIAEIFEHPEMSAFDIHEYLEQIKDILATSKTPNAYAMIQLSEKYIALHKAHHGEKIKKESQNLNVNLNIDMIKFEKRLEELENVK